MNFDVNRIPFEQKRVIKDLVYQVLCGDDQECRKNQEERVSDIVNDAFEKGATLGLPPLKYIVSVSKLIDYSDAAKIWSELYGIPFLPANISEVEEHHNWYIKLQTGDYVVSLPSFVHNLINVIPDATQNNVYIAPVTFFELREIDESGVKGHFFNIISNAQKLGVTDVHFEVREYGVDVKYRLLGELVRIDSIETKTAKRLQQVVKSECSIYTSNFNIEEWQRRQDARIEIEKRKLDLRLAFTPSLVDGMQNYVIRLLSKEAERVKGQEDVEKLGYLEDDIRFIMPFLNYQNGMNIMSGATGSGKSKTFNVLIGLINPKKKILSVEDPVEYIQENAVQHQVFEVKRKDESFSMDYLEYIRAFMRQDPDVIFIGEWRKISELTEGLLYASETGHLVFTTLHASRVVNVPNLLINQYGLTPDDVSNNINILINQRLIKRLCPHCSIEREITEDDILEYKNIRFADKEKLADLVGEVGKFVNHDGCKHCRVHHPDTEEVISAGYAGRTLLYEFLPFTDEIRKQILESTSTLAIEDKFVKMSEENMGKTYVDVAKEKILSGDISVTDGLEKLL